LLCYSIPERDALHDDGHKREACASEAINFRNQPNRFAGGITNNQLMFNRAAWIQNGLTGMGIPQAAFINNRGNLRLNINWGIGMGVTPTANARFR
jgi:hypothetical protein